MSRDNPRALRELLFAGADPAAPLGRPRGFVLRDAGRDTVGPTGEREGDSPLWPAVAVRSVCREAQLVLGHTGGVIAPVGGGDGAPPGSVRLLLAYGAGEADAGRDERSLNAAARVTAAERVLLRAGWGAAAAAGPFTWLGNAEAIASLLAHGECAQRASSKAER